MKRIVNDEQAEADWVRAKSVESLPRLLKDTVAQRKDIEKQMQSMGDLTGKSFRRKRHFLRLDRAHNRMELREKEIRTQMGEIQINVQFVPRTATAEA